MIDWPRRKKERETNLREIAEKMSPARQGPGDHRSRNKPQKGKKEKDGPRDLDEGQREPTEKRGRGAT